MLKKILTGNRKVDVSTKMLLKEITAQIGFATILLCLLTTSLKWLQILTCKWTQNLLYSFSYQGELFWS